MGQALRKVTGSSTKLSSSPSSSSSSRLKDRAEVPMHPRFPAGDVLPGPPPPPLHDLHMGPPEEREWDKSDPMYSAMVKELAGRVVVNQGGAKVTHEEHPQFRRPLPKNRQSSASGFSENNVPPGKLNAGQIKQVFLSYQGLLEGEKAMDVKGLAKKYNVDAALLEKVLKFASIPNPDERNEFKGVTQGSAKPRLE